MEGTVEFVMSAKVDWISISIPSERLITHQLSDLNELYPLVEKGRASKLRRYMLQTAALWEHGKGRAPFSESIHSPKDGWTYFWSPEKNYSLLEITGRGCDNLIARNSIIPVLKDWHDRLTRIDIAYDFVTDINPADFVKYRDMSKFTSTSRYNTATGDTEYVGSQKSDRYARVYKYNPPHPRAGILRVEMVCKDERAKSVGRGIVSDGLSAVVHALGDAFAWQHTLWTDADFASPSDLSVPKENHQGNTERWLLTQVSSAIRKLHENGNKDFLLYWLGQMEDIIKSD